MKRKSIVLTAVAAVAIVAAAVLYAPGLYQRLLAGRLLRAAESEAAEGRSDKAIRLYVLSIQHDPGNLKTLKLFAAYLEKIHDPDELAVLYRIKAMEPGNPDAPLDCAYAALSFGRVSEALRVLAAAGPQTRKLARYYHLASVARFMSGDLPDADANCREALSIEPGNKAYLANQATIELSSPSEPAREAAVARLEKLSGDRETGITALQSLLRYAARSASEPPHLDQWLQAFGHYIQPRDYLYTMRLEVEHRHRPKDFRRDLALYLQSASSDFGPASNAVDWLAQQKLPADVLEFRESVPAGWQDTMEFLAPAVRASFELGGWKQVESLLEKPAWNSFKADALAWRERLRRAEAAPGASPEEEAAQWHQVLAAAGENGPALTRLLDLAMLWGWQDEYRATLWAMAQGVPSESADALEDLLKLDVSTGDSGDLLRVVTRQVDLAPDDPVDLNNLAFLNVLLESDPTRGEATARALVARYPGNPTFLATLAFALFKEGKPEDGLKLFHGMDPAKLRDTAPGATYGLLLAAVGNKDAAVYLKDADAWMRLPEEQILLNEARREVAAAGAGSGR